MQSLMRVFRAIFAVSIVIYLGQLFYVWLRHGLKRKGGLPPIDLHHRPVAYWAIMIWAGLNLIGVTYGAYLILRR